MARRSGRAKLFDMLRRSMPLLASLGLAALLAVGPERARAQSPGPQTLAELTATPEEAATLLLRSVRAIRWSAAGQFMHDDALARFHEAVMWIAEADTSGANREYLVGTDAAGLAALRPAEVFDRAIGALIDDMPGLMHALYDRDDEVLGHVPDGERDAHVVYRTTARISGAQPEVKVMRLRRSDAGGWRVLWSDELEVLDAALGGVPRTRRPPPPLLR